MFLVKRVTITSGDRLKALTDLANFSKPIKKLIIQNVSGQTYVGNSNMSFTSGGNPPSGDYWKSTVVEVDFDHANSLNSIEDIYIINTDSGNSDLLIVAF